MNTFLPSPDFRVTAKVLDTARLQRQIQECRWLAQYLVGDPENHSISSLGKPRCAVLWTNIIGKPLIGHLRKYQLILQDEWRIRFNHKKTHESVVLSKWMDKYPCIGAISWPNEVYASHRRRLVEKNPAHYRAKFSLYNLPVNELLICSYYMAHPSIS